MIVAGSWHLDAFSLMRRDPECSRRLILPRLRLSSNGNMDAFGKDLLYAWRGLQRSPAMRHRPAPKFPDLNQLPVKISQPDHRCGLTCLHRGCGCSPVSKTPGKSAVFAPFSGTVSLGQA